MNNLRIVRCAFFRESFVVSEAVEKFAFLCHSAQYFPYGEAINKGYKLASAARRESFNWFEKVSVDQLWEVGAGRVANFRNGCAVRLAKNTASALMTGVCLVKANLCGDSVVSHRSDGRSVDVCRTLMPNGERCVERDRGRERWRGDGCVGYVKCVAIAALGRCSQSLGGIKSEEFDMMCDELYTDAASGNGRDGE